MDIRVELECSANTVSAAFSRPQIQKKELYTRMTPEALYIVCSCDERDRAEGVKLALCGHGKCSRDLSAEHSMRITVGYGGPARGQAREL